jgi:hypothetical protein
LHPAVGKYAADKFTYYGLAAPKDLQNFGMNVGLECMQMPPNTLVMPLNTLVLTAANKVRGYWHD